MWRQMMAQGACWIWESTHRFELVLNRHDEQNSCCSVDHMPKDPCVCTWYYRNYSLQKFHSVKNLVRIVIAAYKNLHSKISQTTWLYSYVHYIAGRLSHFNAPLHSILIIQIKYLLLSYHGCSQECSWNVHILVDILCHTPYCVPTEKYGF